jgi:uncharacterized protein YbaP (TraB family)
MIRPFTFFFFFALSGFCNFLLAQGKYQSLMWEISGNGLAKPSYLYGTMHISGKMAFHLGDPFYEAIENCDVVALELEPEAWLKAIFEDNTASSFARSNVNWMTDNGFGYEYDDELPALREQFLLDTDFASTVKATMMYDPAILNYLLFRYGDYGFQADFEEDTWLDMYIYQTGKKLGKRTLGLETYQQSDFFIRKARKEELKERDFREYDEGDLRRMDELQKEFEPAYRREDLDLIDSLNKLTSSPAFDKYILVERNKVFIQNIDSVLNAGQSIFAGMGCAHLPGKDGVIELLRAKGYSVKPYNKGERNTKRRAKIDRVIHKRPYVKFSECDPSIQFDAPAEVYFLGSEKNTSSWICLDIPNGASFVVQRVKTYSALTGRNPESVLVSIDSLLYEAIAGDIVSQKRINVNGFQAIEVMNRSRRGDYQRKLIVSLPEELLILKLTATGDKVKSGYGNEFFSSLKITTSNLNELNIWLSEDENMESTLPGSMVNYTNEPRENGSADFEVYSGNYLTREAYLIKRHTIEDPGFLDDDNYELGRLAEAFAEDNELIEISRLATKKDNLPALRVKFERQNGESAFALFALQGLNYYAVTAFVDEEGKANTFFDEVKIKRKKHSQFEVFEDSTMCAKFELPYLPEPQNEESDYFNWNMDFEDELNDAFIGATRSRDYSVPGETERIHLEFQRYHKYSDGEDSLKFYQDKVNALKDPGMYVHSQHVSWNDHGCIIEVLLSDTGCSRRYHYKIIQHNKTVYTLQTSYDTLFGANDFVTRFYNSFQPTDTIFPFYHYKNRDQEFLDQLTSEDSTARNNAIFIVSEMDFSASSVERIRSILSNMPAIKDVKKLEAMQEKLTASLVADTSRVNLDFISRAFYQNNDSTSYQVELLSVLARMRTKAALETYRKLILDEPPVLNGSRSTNSFYPLYDSLELLTQPVLQDFLKLVAINEYEASVYALLATAIDSGVVKPLMYKPMLGQIGMEAKNELKRLNSTMEDSYQFDTEPLMNYCTLLHPFREQTEVKLFFEKAYKTKRAALLLDLIEFDVKHKLIPQDSVITKICAHEDQIIPLYQILFEHQLEKLIPAKFLSKELLISYYIKQKFQSNYSNDSGVDSVTVFHRDKLEIKGHELDVFYCKFRKAKSKQWMGNVIAFDARDSKNLWPLFIESKKTTVLDKDENERAELDRELKFLVESNRKRINYTHGKAYRMSDWD